MLEFIHLKPLPKAFIILPLALIIIIRVILFVRDYGGIHLDSGSYIGVARNLAQRGIYASYTNTIRDEGVGPFSTIHNRFSVQDKDGFVHFPAAVSVGPGFIVPEALILKIFGPGFWQYRALSLFSFSLLLIILLYLAFSFGGIISSIILSLWLWFFPQIYINYAYESFSEQLALLYFVLSILLLVRSRFRLKSLAFLAGCCYMASVLTKSLFLLLAPAYIPAIVISFFRRPRRPWFLLWCCFALGVIIPKVTFETYKNSYLASKFGPQAITAVKKDQQIYFQTAGSGLNNIAHRKQFWYNWAQNWHFPYFHQKLGVVTDIGFRSSDIVLVWLFIPAIFLYLFFKLPQRRLLLLSFLFGLAPVFLWFVLISPNGWARHAWPLIILTMLLFSAGLGLIIRTPFTSKKSFLLSVIGLYLFSGIFLDAKAEPRFLLDSSSVNHWLSTRFARGPEGFPSVEIYSKADQDQLTGYINHQLSSTDRIYYHQSYLMSEVSLFTDRVLYSIDRYGTLGFTNPDGGNSYMVFGGSQIGPSRIVNNDYLPAQINHYCQRVVFSNSTYLLCRLKDQI